MRLLLDTHAIIWWTERNPNLSRLAYDAVADGSNDVFASAVSTYEITYKFRRGGLPGLERLARNFEVEMVAEGFLLLPLSPAQAEVGGLLNIAHRDPFDRLLIAQAQVEGLTLVSNERLFDDFSVNRLW